MEDENGAKNVTDGNVKFQVYEVANKLRNFPLTEPGVLINYDRLTVGTDSHCPLRKGFLLTGVSPIVNLWLRSPLLFRFA